MAEISSCLADLMSLAYSAIPNNFFVLIGPVFAAIIVIKVVKSL